jgi:replication-associated recombination protein RarA
VGIAAERIRPENLPGYVGQVSALESLSIAWGAAKHAMIKNVIYHGNAGQSKKED